MAEEDSAWERARHEALGCGEAGSHCIYSDEEKDEARLEFELLTYQLGTIAHNIEADHDVISSSPLSRPALNDCPYTVEDHRGEVEHWARTGRLVPQ